MLQSLRWLERMFLGCFLNKIWLYHASFSVVHKNLEEAPTSFVGWPYLKKNAGAWMSDTIIYFVNRHLDGISVNISFATCVLYAD